MNPKTFLFAGILMAIIFLTGCLQQQYVCPDGSVVSSPGQCPEPEAPVISNESAAQNESGIDNAMPAVNESPQEMVVEPVPEEQSPSEPEEAPEVFLSQSFCDDLDNSFTRNICDDGNFHEDQLVRDYLDKYDAIISDTKDLDDISDDLDNDYDAFFGSQNLGEAQQHYDSFSSNKDDYEDLLGDAKGRIDAFVSFIVSNKEFLEGEGVDVLQDVGDMSDLKSEEQSVLSKAEADYAIMTTMMENAGMSNETLDLVMPEPDDEVLINISKIHKFILN